MTTKQGRRIRLSPLILAVTGSLAIAACGSSGASTKTSTTASASNNRAKLAACLKQHGVTLSAHRPGSGHGGVFGGGARPTGGSGRFFGNSKFRTAFKDCGGGFGHFRSGAGRAGHHFSAATLGKFVTCVANHGYKLPKPNTSGSGPVFPRSIESSKKFQAAAKSCVSLLRPSAPSAPSTTSSS